MRAGLILAMAAALVFGSLSAGDLTITFATKGKAMAGSGGGGSEIHYYSPNYQMTRNPDAQHDTLVDFTKGITYVIDHKKKTITRITFDDAVAALDSLNQAGSNTMMASLFGDPNNCKVEKTGVEKILDRNCQGWHIMVGKLTMDLSADPALKLPISDAAYARMVQVRAAQFAKAGPMGATFKRLYEEMAKIKGIPLKTHMSGFMGTDTVTEATKIETTPIPPSTFALPQGYKETDMGKTLRDQAAKTP
jgi:hypothetical protein